LSELVTDTVESTSDQLLTEAKKKPSKLSHVTPPQHHHHLSNRDRKELARREKKERRANEKRKSVKKPSVDIEPVEDALGSLRI
jgi:hypothetical protein